LLATLAWLGPQAAALREDFQSLGAELPKKHRVAVERALALMGPAAEPPGCCAPWGVADWRGPARRSAREVAGVEFEDQDGARISFADYFTGQPTIGVFFYTRCDNPLKCSLSITNLGVVQRLLEERGLGDSIRTAAITYDPAFDLAGRLRTYGRERGLRPGPNHRILRAPEGGAALREYFQLGVNFVESVVNRHRIELFVLDRNGRVAAAFERIRWDAAQVVEKAVEVARERAPVKARAGLLGSAASVALALLPKCPACWAAYLGMAGASGLPVGWLAALQPLLMAFVLLNVAMGTVRARRTGRFKSLALVGAGALAILCWLAGANLPGLREAGILLTLAGSIWSIADDQR
jgi:protein SCO1/2